MTEQPASTKPIELVDLAAARDFTLGALRVQPSVRRVSAGAHEESVEPRVMQALVALAEAGGTVVSRDALIDRCWGGRIVGEDAINRCIAKVRRLADTTVPPAFTIETVAKVGYLLKGTACPADVMDPHPFRPIDVPARARTPEAVQSRWWLLAIAGRQIIEDRPAGRRVPHWRAAAIAAVFLSFAAIGADLALRSAAPLATLQAISPPVPFEPPPHSVAVLAFANLSNDAGQDYLSDGLSEALIDLLSRVNQLQVTARTSSFYFKSHPSTIEEIARKLNVGAVLEGSLRRQGQHLRIDVHLSDGRTGAQLWSQSYDRTLDDLLKLQDEIAAAAAGALQVKLLDAEAAGFGLGGTANPLAFDAYLKGEQHARILGGESEASLAEFRRAVALDPDFALAQGSLGLTLALISQGSANDGLYRQRMAEARRIADRAVELAPGLGLLHAQRAMVLRDGVADMTAAWAEASRAKALTPGDAAVQSQFALIARAVGHIDEAVAAARRAVELDPLRADAWWPLGRVLGCARKYDAARDAFERSIMLMEHAPLYAAWELGSLLLKQGKADAARQMCATDPNGFGLECLVIADHALGRRADAEAELARMHTEWGESGAYNFSEIYAQWNQPALAMQWLTKARQINDPGLAELKCDEWLDPIRTLPAFRDIEQSLHFPPPG